MYVNIFFLVYQMPFEFVVFLRYRTQFFLIIRFNRFLLYGSWFLGATYLLLCMIRHNFTWIFFGIVSKLHSLPLSLSSFWNLFSIWGEVIYPIIFLLGLLIVPQTLNHLFFSYSFEGYLYHRVIPWCIWVPCRFVK